MSNREHPRSYVIETLLCVVGIAGLISMLKAKPQSTDTSNSHGPPTSNHQPSAPPLKSNDKWNKKTAIWTQRAAIYSRQSAVAQIGISLLLFVVTARQCSISSQQANIAQQQTDITKKQLEESQAEQRAWVSDMAVRAVSLTIDTINNRLNTTIEVRFQNTGKSPAVFIQLDAEASFKEGAPPYDSIREWQRVVCKRAEAGIDHFGFSMFPGQQQASLQPDFVTTQQPGIILTMPQFPVEALADMQRKGTTSLLMPLIAGCIVYKDAVTTKIHWTPLVFRLLRRDGGGLVGFSDLPLTSESLILRPFTMDTLPPT